MPVYLTIRYGTDRTVPYRSLTGTGSGTGSADLDLYYSFMQILGLEICADTMVRDIMIRGIFGGQKKCVTTGKSNKKKKRLD